MTYMGYLVNAIKAAAKRLKMAEKTAAEFSGINNVFAHAAVVDAQIRADKAYEDLLDAEDELDNYLDGQPTAEEAAAGRKAVAEAKAEAMKKANLRALVGKEICTARRNANLAEVIARLEAAMATKPTGKIGFLILCQYYGCRKVKRGVYHGIEFQPLTGDALKAAAEAAKAEVKAEEDRKAEAEAAKIEAEKAAAEAAEAARIERERISAEKAEAAKAEAKANRERVSAALSAVTTAAVTTAAPVTTKKAETTKAPKTTKAPETTKTPFAAIGSAVAAFVTVIVSFFSYVGLKVRLRHAGKRFIAAKAEFSAQQGNVSPYRINNLVKSTSWMKRETRKTKFIKRAKRVIRKKRLVRVYTKRALKPKAAKKLIKMQRELQTAIRDTRRIYKEINHDLSDALKIRIKGAKPQPALDGYSNLIREIKESLNKVGANLSALRHMSKNIDRLLGFNVPATAKAVLGSTDGIRIGNFTEATIELDRTMAASVNDQIRKMSYGDYRTVVFTDVDGRLYFMGHNNGANLPIRTAQFAKWDWNNSATVITCNADKLFPDHNHLGIDCKVEVEVIGNTLHVRRHDTVSFAVKETIREIRGNGPSAYLVDTMLDYYPAKLEKLIADAEILAHEAKNAANIYDGYRDENGDPINEDMARMANNDYKFAKSQIAKLLKDIAYWANCKYAINEKTDASGETWIIPYFYGLNVKYCDRIRNTVVLGIETNSAPEKADGNIYKEVTEMTIRDQNQILADLRKHHLEVSENLKRECNPGKVAALKAELAEIEKAASPLEDASDARFEARANAKKVEANKKAETERKATKEELEAVKAKNFHFVDMASDNRGTEGEDEAAKAHVEAIRGRKNYVSTSEKVAYLGDKASDYLDERARYAHDLEVEKSKFFKELTDSINRGQKTAFDAAAIRWQYVFMGTNLNAAYETRVREGQVAALVSKIFAGAGTEKTLETAKSLLAAVQRAEHDPEFEGISLDSEFGISEAFEKIQGGMRKYLAAYFHGCYRSLFGLFGTESNGYVQGLDWIMATDVKDVVVINGLKATTTMKADDHRKIEAIDMRRKALSWALHRKMALIAENHLGLEAKEEKVTSLLYINLGGKAFEDISALEEALKVETDPQKVAKISANLEKAREAFKVQAAKAFVELAREEYRNGYDSEYLGKVTSREENLNKILTRKIGSSTILADLIAIQREEREIQARYRLAVRAIRDKYAETTAKDELDELYQAKLRKYGEYELDVFEAAELEDARLAELEDRFVKVKCDRGENAVWNLMTMINFPKRLDATWEMIRACAIENGYKVPKNALVWASVNALGLDTTLYNILDVQPKVKALIHANTFHDVEAFADFVLEAFAVIGQTEEVYDERSGRNINSYINIHSQWMETLAYWGCTLTKERIIQMLTFKLVGDDRLFFEPAGFGDDELTKLDAMSMCAHTSKALPATWLSAIWGRKVPGSWESCLAAENPMDPTAISGVAYLNEEETSEYLGEGYGIDVNPDHHARAYTEEYADIRKKNQLLVSDWSDIIIFCCQYMLYLATGIEDPFKAGKAAQDDLKKAIEEGTEPGLAGTIARRLAEERPEALCERLANGAKVGDMLTEWMPQQMQADINGYPMSKWVVDKVAEVFVGNVNRTHNAEFTDWLCAGSDPTESGCIALAKLYAEKQQKDGSETTEAEVKGQKPEDEDKKAEAAAWDELNG